MDALTQIVKARARQFTDDNFLNPTEADYLRIEGAMLAGVAIAQTEEAIALIAESYCISDEEARELFKERQPSVPKS